MYTLFNAQFPKGRDFDSLAEASTYLTGWRLAWVEDASGAVVAGDEASKQSAKFGRESVEG